MSVTVMSSTFHRQRSKPLQKALVRLSGKARLGGVEHRVYGDDRENCAARASELFEMIRIVFRRAASKDSHVLDHRHILS
jgi:hypothetical protein